MRVLLVANADSVHTVRWANSLAQQGVDVHLTHIAGHAAQAEDLEPNITVHPLPVGGGAGYYLNALPLRLLAEKLRPDVTHAHYASGYGTLVRLARVPYLLSVWGSDVYDFPYHGPLNLHLIQRNLRHAVALASTSNCMADQVRILLKDHTYPVAVTPFGVDLEQFDPERYPAALTGDKLVIGNVKALAEPYGIDVLIKAIRLLLDRLPSLSCEVRVYGEGPLRPALEDLVRQLNLSEVVHLTGGIAHDEVPRVLSELDIFCATSRYESFGVAVAEAMAMRRPVVASATPGFTEVLGDAGLIVDPDDEVQTAAALAQLAENPGLRETFSAAGRQRVETNYDWDSNVEAMIRLYEQVIGLR